jgi:uncharacterized protein (TIGR00730 family)
MASICVYCSSSELIDPAYLDLAWELGAELAGRGHTLVSGGGRVSMMGAVARAARAGGAHTTGVIPQALVGWEVADHDADELLVTPDMRSRKAAMDERSDAFIALPGGIGTLEELLEIWVARTLGLHAKPVVILDPDGTYAGLRALLKSLQDKGFVRPEAAAALTWASSATAALNAIERELSAGEGSATPLTGPAARAREVLESEVDPPGR